MGNFLGDNKNNQNNNNNGGNENRGDDGHAGNTGPRVDENAERTSKVRTKLSIAEKKYFDEEFKEHSAEFGWDKTHVFSVMKREVMYSDATKDAIQAKLVKFIQKTVMGGDINEVSIMSLGIYNTFVDYVTDMMNESLEQLSAYNQEYSDNFPSQKMCSDGAYDWLMINYADIRACFDSRQNCFHFRVAFKSAIYRKEIVVGEADEVEEEEPLAEVAHAEADAEADAEAEEDGQPPHEEEQQNAGNVNNDNNNNANANASARNINDANNLVNNMGCYSFVGAETAGVKPSENAKSNTNVKQSVNNAEPNADNNNSGDKHGTEKYQSR